MSVTESVSSFSEFSHVYSSCTTLTHELARLFDKCEFDKEETISFKEATKRLRTAVDNSISAVEISTKRKVSEFRIGKTYVKSQLDRTFDPMQPMTWGTIGGTNMKWGTHKKDNYDGLIEVGCVTNELIPKDIKEANTAIHMGHQMYALVMTQSLVHHYMVQKPNGKLRNKSFDIGYCSEEETEYKGSIIYIAYKLESEKISEVDGLAIKKEEQEREEKERIDMERKINVERINKEIEKLEANADVKQKDRDIEIEERERMRVGKSSSGGGDKPMGKEDSNMLYRLLRPDESYEDGLRAKNPNSTRSVFDHVISGSCGKQSKYISTCGSWEAVNSFRSNSANPGSIVKIQKDRLPLGFEIIDLRRQENRNHYIDDDMDIGSIEQFNNFANTFQEVLLVGHVPGECIELCDD